jgi:hypothetical protein
MEYAMGPIFIRENRLARAGDKVHLHKHNFAHVSVVERGSAFIVKLAERVDEKGVTLVDSEGAPILIKIAEREFKAVSRFLVDSNEWHEITALEDNTLVSCEFTHRSPDGEVLQQYGGWYEATT